MRNEYLRDMSDDEYFGHLSLGHIQGSRRWSKFGRNDDVDTANEELISHNGIYGLPTTADTIVITSNDAADAPAGAGARKMKIWGLDENWELADEEIELGATSTKQFIRVFTARVVETGNTAPIEGSNQGTISINQTGGTPMLSITPYEGSSLCACFTVPKGMTALIWDATTTTGKNKDTTNRLKVRNAADPLAAFTTEGIRDNFENQVGRTFVIPSPVPEMHDIVFTATTENNNTGVSAAFVMELVTM